MAETACKGKHTKYQPTQEEWKCPKCGADVGNFYIYESGADADDSCGDLHTDDDLRCKCGHQESGKTFAARLQKKNNLTTCTACKGTGLVQKK